MQYVCHLYVSAKTTVLRQSGLNIYAYILQNV
jgi:hypothetical protein